MLSKNQEGGRFDRSRTVEMISSIQGGIGSAILSDDGVVGRGKTLKKNPPSNFLQAGAP